MPPLFPGKSKKAFSTNVETEMDAGKPQKQSLAIAFNMQKRPKKKKMAEGGVVSKDPLNNYAKPNPATKTWTDDPSLISDKTIDEERSPITERKSNLGYADGKYADGGLVAPKRSGKANGTPTSWTSDPSLIKDSTLDRERSPITGKRGDMDQSAGRHSGAEEDTGGAIIDESTPIDEKQRVKSYDERPYDDEAAGKFAEGGQVGAPEEKLQFPPTPMKEADFHPSEFMTDEERAHTIAEAIMRKRKERKMAEGGMVDLEENETEEPYGEELEDRLEDSTSDSLGHINDLKENYNDEDTSMVSKIRKSLKSRRGM